MLHRHGDAGLAERVGRAVSHDRPSGPAQCFNCGDEAIGRDDWDYIGDRSYYCCASPRCQQAMRDANREIDEHAMLDAMDDNYDRYR